MYRTYGMFSISVLLLLYKVETVMHIDRYFVLQPVGTR